jgi:hypothetical protein
MQTGISGAAPTTDYFISETLVRNSETLVRNAAANHSGLIKSPKVSGTPRAAIKLRFVTARITPNKSRPAAGHPAWMCSRLYADVRQHDSPESIYVRRAAITD